MKNVYFVQVDISACHGAQNAYLPYTAGILAANAWESEIVKKEYAFKEFIFLREDINAVISRMVEPAIVAFCNYCWNTEYNKALAQAIKQKFPDCVIVFGGHNVPDDFSFLESFSYIDILAHGEGEQTIKILFETLAKNDPLKNVPNISFRDGDDKYIRTETLLPKTLNYPSPYLEGWFDDILSTHPDITFNAILETSRGCPHQCAYCDWGLLKSKVRLFPIERVKAEIKWMSEHKISFVWGADANFGLFSRDLEIADALVHSKEKYGYPENLRINYAKNNYKNVFNIIKKFKSCNFDKIGATLSFQSLSPIVLKNIGRTNDSLLFYQNLLAKYNKDNMRTYSELILALPGETYESFISGIGKLFEIGQHFIFEVYVCILLPNSILGQKETKKKFGIETVDTEMVRAHFLNQKSDVTEYKTIVTQTNSMSREMWIRSLVFSHIAKAFHASGLLRVFAIYLFTEKKIPYEKFYDGIIDYLESNPSYFTSGIYSIIKNQAREQAYGADDQKLTFAPAGGTVWEDNEFLVLNALNNLDEFYSDMTDYLKSFDIEKSVFKDLMNYQKSILRRPDDEKQIVSLEYDVHAFISGVYTNKTQTLKKRANTLIMHDTNVYTNWQDFAKYVIWYGRMGWSSYKDDIMYQ